MTFERSENFVEVSPSNELLGAARLLAAPLAHHLNNSLCVIIGYTELAMADLSRRSKQCSDLIEVRNAGEQSAELIRQILTFAGKQFVATESIDLATVVGRHLERHRPTGGLEFVPGPSAGDIRMDTKQLKRLIDILLSNAFAAIEGGGYVNVRTTHRIESAPGGRGQAREFNDLIVSDTGRGITPTMLPTILDPFVTTDRFAHTGMGLAEAYGIVSVAGGSIAIASEPCEGSTFRISFPVERPGRKG